MVVERVRCALEHVLAQGVCHANCRAVVGMLKGFDQLMNLVLDDVQEVMRGEFFLLLHGNRRY